MMANMAVSRIKREFKEVIKSEEVRINDFFKYFFNLCMLKKTKTYLLFSGICHFF